MQKIYLAGSLFKEADIKQRILEAIELREMGFEVYNPITDAKFNTNKEGIPQPIEIARGDLRHIDECDMIVVNLDDSMTDTGVCAEIGYLYGKYSQSKKLYGVISDIRLSTSNKYPIPSLGMNHFLLGMIELLDGKIFKSFEELKENLIKGELRSTANYHKG